MVSAGKIPPFLRQIIRPWLIRKGYIQILIIRRSGIVSCYYENIKNRQEITLEGLTRKINADAIVNFSGWPTLIYQELSTEPIPRTGEINSEIPPRLFNQLLQEHYEAGYQKAKVEMKLRERTATILALGAVAIMGGAIYMLYTQQQQLAQEIAKMSQEIAKLMTALS